MDAGPVISLGLRSEVMKNSTHRPRGSQVCLPLVRAVAPAPSKPGVLNPEFMDAAVCIELGKL